MEIATPKMVSLSGSNNWLILKAKIEDILHCKDMYEPIKGRSQMICPKKNGRN